MRPARASMHMVDRLRRCRVHGDHPLLALLEAHHDHLPDDIPGLCCVSLVRIVHSNLRNRGRLFRGCGESECIILNLRSFLCHASCLVPSGSVSCYVSLLPHCEPDPTKELRSLRPRTSVYIRGQRLGRSNVEKCIRFRFIPLMVSRIVLSFRKAACSLMHHGD